MAEEKYLKQYEKSATGNYLLRSRGILANIITQGDVDTVLTQEDSGSAVLVTVTIATNVAVTLPAAKAGLEFKFVNCVSNAAAGDLVISAAVAGTIVALSAGDADADGATDLAADSVTIEAASVGGEVIDFICDGTTWFASVKQSAIGSVTFA